VRPLDHGYVVYSKKPTTEENPCERQFKVAIDIEK